jgi:hypothetical protein
MAPTRAMTRGAITTMPSVMATVIGSSAAPPSKAPNPRTSGLRPRSARMSGSATPMMLVSMMTMNCASAMTARAVQRRGLTAGGMPSPRGERPGGWDGCGGVRRPRAAPERATSLERGANCRAR